MPIVAARPGPKPEPVSARLKQTLIHPNKTSYLASVAYLPEGKRIIAADFPGGVVQVWDAETGKQLTKIETGYGYRGSAQYLFHSPDWKLVYVSRIKRKVTRFEKGDKKLIRWEFDGDVRAWDLATGQLRHTYKHSPIRGIYAMLLSPDGSTFVTFEELAGESEGSAQRTASLWDVKTQKHRPLPGRLSYVSVYSPDGKTLAAPALNENHELTALQLFEVATAQEKIALPVKVKGATPGFTMFSPDGKILVSQVRVYNTGQHWLKLWEVASGREVASIEGGKKEYFIWMAFSPDSKVLAVTNSRSAQAKLLLFDIPRKKPIKTVVLDKTVASGETTYAGEPIFSPDGRWIAVTTRVFPKEYFELTAEEMAQPRIQLLDVAAGAVRETLIAPPGDSTAGCFSPDGKTLATGGHGKVLLWDLTHLGRRSGPGRK